MSAVLAWMIPHPLHSRQGPLLVWNSPSSLGCLAREPQEYPISTSPVQVCTTTPGILMWFLESNSDTVACEQAVRKLDHLSSSVPSPCLEISSSFVWWEGSKQWASLMLSARWDSALHTASSAQPRQRRGSRVLAFDSAASKETVHGFRSQQRHSQRVARGGP